MVYAESLRSFALPANLKRKAVQVFVAVVLATPALVKPPPASAVIRGSSFYTIVNGPFWTQAEANAVLLGGHLAAITSASENTFLTQAYFDNQLLQRPTQTVVDRRAWFGLVPTSQGAWQWSDGTLVTYTNWYAPQVATNGVIPQPTNGLQIGQTFDINISFDPGSNGRWENGTPPPTEPLNGIAEIPIAFSASQSASPIEGSGLFTTSLFFSAGTGSNLVDGATIYWGLDGITADDLSSGTMTGFGVVTNGRLDIIHSLFDDGVDEIENFIVTAYSDPILRTSDYQIGTYSAPVRSATSSTASVPGPLPILGLSSVFYWTRRLRKRIKNNKATLRVASADRG